MKKKICLLINLILFLPITVFACDVQVESVFPKYDTTNKAIITSLSKIFGVKLNDNDQRVLYEVTLNNTCDKDATITDITMLDSDYSFIDYNYDGLSKDDVIEANSKKMFYLDVSSNLEKTIDGIQDEYSLSLDYTYDKIIPEEEQKTPTIIENILNPNTFTMPLLAIVLFILALSIIAFVKNKKKPNQFMNILLFIALSGIAIINVNAYDTKRLVIRGVVNYDESSKGKGLSVTIDPNGGKLNNRTDKYNILVEKGFVLDLANIIKDKYTLTGWSLNSEVKETNEIEIQEGSIIIANWEKTKYKLSIDLDGGTLDETTENIEMMLPEEDTYELGTPTKQHYKFYGWVETTSTGSLNENTVTIGNANITIKAVWIDDTDEEFVVTLDPNGGEVSKTYQIKHRGEEYNLPIPTRKGYSFDGWYNEEDVKINSTDKFNLVENQSLKAKWKINSYNLTLDYKTPGKQNGVIKIEFESTIGTLEEPTRPGYIFEGWFDKDDNEVQSEDKYLSAADTTIFAHWIAKTYLLEFDANGGVVSDNNKSVVFNESYGELPTPRRTGYEFVGWFTDETEGTQVNNTTKFTTADNITIYAHWRSSKETPYVVNYWQQNLSGDSEKHDSTNYTLKDKQNLIGETGTKINPTPKEYTGFKTPEVIEETIAADGSTAVNYYYSRNKYLVNVETTIGVETASESKEHLYGEEVAIEYTIKSGYSFASITGDYNDSTFTMPAKEVTITINTNPNTYTITFDANGGNTTTRTKEVVYNETYGKLDKPTRTGYTFDGWHKELNRESRINEDSKVEITNDQTLYAHWVAKQVTGIFDSNGGTLSGSTNTYVLTYGSPYGTLPTASKVGYKFLGWFTDETDGIEIKSSSIVEFEKPFQLYAHYEANKYTISFNAGLGTVDPTSKQVSYNSTYGELPTATREGYLFIGWYDEEDKEILSETVFKTTSNKTLYAKYSKDAYVVTFNPNGGNISQTSKNVTFDENYGTLPQPTMNGYTFKGWYKDDTYTTEIKENTIVTTASNHSLIAKWEVNKYTVTYDANNGIVSPETKEIAFNSTYGELATPSRAGYSFVGWFTDKTFNVKINEDTPVVKYEDHTIYAGWTPNQYLVIFDPTDGVLETENKNVEFDSTYGELPTPTKTGYTFAGWYTSKNGGEEITSETKVKITDEQTLYAHWTPNQYAITLDGNTGTVNAETNTMIVEFGSTYGKLPTASKTGYTFVGWYSEPTGGEYITKDTKITKAGVNTIYAHYTANEYTVTFENNGGTSTTSNKTIKYDGTYGELPSPSKEGYTFKTWFDENDNEITYDTIVSKTSDHTLYAQYTKNKYLVNFEPLDGETTLSSKYVIHDEAYGELPEATKTGYTFNGWYTDVTWTKKIESTTNVDAVGIHTLYAKYTANKYTVTFDANNGTVGTNNKEVTYDSTYGTLPTPTRTGYEFQGWYTSKTSGTEIAAINKVEITSDITLYAIWKNEEHTVYFNANEGNVDIESISVEFDNEYGELPTPTREGYEFLGWYTNKNLGEQVTSDTIVKITNNQTLYAHWNAKLFTITYDAQGGNLGTETNTKIVTYDSSYGTLPSPTKTGYTFDGWYTEKTDGELITSSTSVKITKATTLYARYTANKYTVTLDPGDGTVTPTSIEVTYDQPYTNLPEATKTGYTFMDWYDENGVKVLNDTIVKITENQTLYADYSNQAFRVTFDAGEGETTVTSIKVEYDKKYGTLPTATREGYIFNGWYTDDTYTTKITEDTTVKLSANQTLVAKYTIKTFEITFNSYGGTEVNETMIATWGKPYGTLPTTTKTGYKFLGWFRAFDGNDEVKSSHIVGDLGGNIILYAHWEANTYTLTYEPNGGTMESESKEITYDLPYGSLETPEKTGYTFKGWYYDYELNNKVDPTVLVKDTDNITIYAKWEANKFNVDFEYNGGTTGVENKEVTYDNTFGELPETEKTGYTFGGWFTELPDGDNITSSTKVKITNDITLYALWNVNSYTLTFDANGGIVSEDSKTITYDQEYGELPIPTRTGYKFEGWFTDKEESNQITSTNIVKVTDNQKVYAHWTANKHTLTINANGGEVDPTSMEITYGKSYGSLPTPTREGYTFSGWFLDETFKNQVVRSTTVKIDDDHQIIAAWTPKTNTPYTINYWQQKLNSDADKQDEDNYTLVEFEALTGTTASTVIPTVRPYEGFTSPSSKSLTIAADGKAVMNYYYTRNSYELTVNTTTGISSATSSGTRQYDETIDINYTVSTGYKFTGITGDKTVTSFQMPASDISITVNAEANKYNITFNPNGSTIENGSKEVTYDQTYGSLPIPNDKEGYTFAGWYTSDKFTKKVEEDDVVKITSDITLYAKWNAITSNVTFETGKGTKVNDVITVTYDNKYGSLPTSERTGYSFAGWYTSATDGEEITSTTIVKIKEDQVLYAHWNLAVTSEIRTVANYDTKDYYSSTYKSRIKTITFENDIDVPEDAIASWDVSSAKNNSVMAYVLENSTSTETDKYYDLYIQGYENVVGNQDSSNLFRDLYALETIKNPEYFDASNVTKMNYTFSQTGMNADEINYDLSSWNVENVTSLDYTFSNAGVNSSKVILDVSTWDTTKVTSMNQTFESLGAQATELSLDVSGFVTDNVETMAKTFKNTGKEATQLTIDVSNWNTTNVTNMNGMFYNTGSKDTQFELDVSGFVTNKVVDMSEMFFKTGNMSQIIELNVSGFNTSNVTNMTSMFAGAGYNNENFNLDVSHFNTSQVESISGMFSSTGYNSKVFNPDVSGFILSKVTSLDKMFYRAGYNSEVFNPDVSRWSTINVNSMSGVFQDAGHASTVMNINPSSWNTAKVTNMNNLFDGAGYSSTVMSLDLSSWNLDQVVSMNATFRNTGYSNPDFSLNISTWTATKVKDMSNMFYDTGYSNQNLVIDISNMTFQSVTQRTDFAHTNYGIKFIVADSNVKTKIDGYNLSGVTTEIKS